MILSYGISETGNSSKGINQDSILVRNNGRTGIFAVSDGVGGMKNGEVASSMVCKKIEEAWNIIERNELLNIKDIVTIIKQKLVECHEEILSNFGNTSGATVVILTISDEMCAVVWAGDSRCYMMNKDSQIFTMLSKDDIEDVENKKNAKITNAIGFFSKPMLNVVYLNYGKRAVFLLMSDGIYKYVNKESISDAARLCFVYEKVGQASENLKSEVYKNGAGDNLSLITVVAVHDS